MRLLLVEDQKDLTDDIKLGLDEAGYTVDVARDGLEGERHAMTNRYDVMVINSALPQQSGAMLVKHLREAGITTPVLMLMAHDATESRLQKSDADDYLTKPFTLGELLARLRTLNRRVPPAMRLEVGPLVADQRDRKMYWKNEELPLRPKEYELLVLLMRNHDTVVSRTALSDSVWESVFVTDDTINTTVSHLRGKLRKMRNNDQSPRIETVRGVGYRLATSA